MTGDLARACIVDVSDRGRVSWRGCVPSTSPSWAGMRGVPTPETLDALGLGFAKSLIPLLGPSVASG